jgi:hypothetical protein
VRAVACLIDPVAHEVQARALEGEAAGVAGTDDRARDVRALRHSLAEHDIPSFLIDPVHSLGEQLVNAASARREAAA